jgi:hypothetical protein
MFGVGYGLQGASIGVLNTNLHLLGVGAYVGGLYQVANAWHSVSTAQRQAALAANSVTAANTRAAAANSRLIATGSTLGIVFGTIAMSLKSTAMESVGLAAAFKQTSFGFETLLGSGRAATEMLKQIQQYALKTPYNFSQTAQSVQFLLTSGVAAARVIPILEGIGSGIAAAGKGSAELQRALAVIAKMQTSGVTQIRLNQLGLVGIPAARILRKELNLTMDQMRSIGKMHLDPTKTVGILTDYLSRRYGERTKQLRYTPAGVAGELEDTREAALRMIGVDLLPWLMGVQQQSIKLYNAFMNLTPSTRRLLEGTIAATVGLGLLGSVTLIVTGLSRQAKLQQLELAAAQRALGISSTQASGGMGALAFRTGLTALAVVGAAYAWNRFHAKLQYGLFDKQINSIDHFLNVLNLTIDKVKFLLGMGGFDKNLNMYDTQANYFRGRATNDENRELAKASGSLRQKVNSGQMSEEAANAKYREISEGIERRIAARFAAAGSQADVSIYNEKIAKIRQGRLLAPGDTDEYGTAGSQGAPTFVRGLFMSNDEDDKTGGSGSSGTQAAAEAFIKRFLPGGKGIGSYGAGAVGPNAVGQNAIGNNSVGAGGIGHNVTINQNFNGSSQENESAPSGVIPSDLMEHLRKGNVAGAVASVARSRARQIISPTEDSPSAGTTQAQGSSITAGQALGVTGVGAVGYLAADAYITKRYFSKAARTALTTAEASRNALLTEAGTAANNVHQAERELEHATNSVNRITEEAARRAERASRIRDRALSTAERNIARAQENLTLFNRRFRPEQIHGRGNLPLEVFRDLQTGNTITEQQYRTGLAQAENAVRDADQTGARSIAEAERSFQNARASIQHSTANKIARSERAAARAAEALETARRGQSRVNSALTNAENDVARAAGNVSKTGMKGIFKRSLKVAGVAGEIATGLAVGHTVSHNIDALGGSNANVKGATAGGLSAFLGGLALIPGFSSKAITTTRLMGLGKAIPTTVGKMAGQAAIPIAVSSILADEMSHTLDIEDVRAQGVIATTDGKKVGRDRPQNWKFWDYKKQIEALRDRQINLYREGNIYSDTGVGEGADIHDLGSRGVSSNRGLGGIFGNIRYSMEAFRTRFLNSKRTGGALSGGTSIESTMAENDRAKDKEVKSIQFEIDRLRKLEAIELRGLAIKIRRQGVPDLKNIPLQEYNKLGRKLRQSAELYAKKHPEWIPIVAKHFEDRTKAIEARNRALGITSTSNEEKTGGAVESQYMKDLKMGIYNTSSDINGLMGSHFAPMYGRNGAAVNPLVDAKASLSQMVKNYAYASAHGGKAPTANGVRIPTPQEFLQGGTTASTAETASTHPAAPVAALTQHFANVITKVIAKSKPKGIAHRTVAAAVDNAARDININRGPAPIVYDESSAAMGVNQKYAMAVKAKQSRDAVSAQGHTRKLAELMRSQGIKPLWGAYVSSDSTMRSLGMQLENSTNEEKPVVQAAIDKRIEELKRLHSKEWAAEEKFQRESEIRANRGKRSASSKGFLQQMGEFFFGSPASANEVAPRLARSLSRSTSRLPLSSPESMAASQAREGRESAARERARANELAEYKRWYKSNYGIDYKGAHSVGSGFNVLSASRIKADQTKEAKTRQDAIIQIQNATISIGSMNGAGKDDTYRFTRTAAYDQEAIRKTFEGGEANSVFSTVASYKRSGGGIYGNGGAAIVPDKMLHEMAAQDPKSGKWFDLANQSDPTSKRLLDKITTDRALEMSGIGVKNKLNIADKTLVALSRTSVEGKTGTGLNSTFTIANAVLNIANATTGSGVAASSPTATIDAQTKLKALTDEETYIKKRIAGLNARSADPNTSDALLASRANIRLGLATRLQGIAGEKTALQTQIAENLKREAQGKNFSTLNGTVLPNALTQMSLSPNAQVPAAPSNGGLVLPTAAFLPGAANLSSGAPTKSVAKVSQASPRGGHKIEINLPPTPADTSIWEMQQQVKAPSRGGATKVRGR